jgi:hypothetical protein
MGNRRGKIRFYFFLFKKFGTKKEVDQRRGKGALQTAVLERKPGNWRGLNFSTPCGFNTFLDFISNGNQN